MSNLDPANLSEIVRRALESRVNDVHTCCPGQVQSYDSSTQTVNVLPMVTRPLPTLDDTTVYEKLPVIPNCRVAFPRSKKFSITFPLEAGDEGLLLFTNWDIATWLNTGQVSDPIDLRLHHPGNALFLPGVCSDPNVLATDPGTSALVLQGLDVRLGDVSASDEVTLAGALYSGLDALFSSWTPVPNDGGAALKTAWAAWKIAHPSPGPWAAAQVKAK